MNRIATSESIEWLKSQHRLTNYIAAASLYLKENFLLTEPLKTDHIKPRILGHWGTVPGLNLIYGAINQLIKETNQQTLFITGPGHGAPAILSQLWLEASLAKFYPQYTRDVTGLGNLIHDFSWPKRLPSHTYPGLPGSIHEGGELGYSLGTAFGASFDHPELMTVAVIGDGEAETGALAASWHSNKFWNPVKDGYVLPIVHINGYKISNPTIFGTMSRSELEHYFVGLGYRPIWVSQYESEDIYKDLLNAVYECYRVLEYTRSMHAPGIKPLLPVLLLKTKKGWTGPAYNGDIKLEDNNYSHGIPLKEPKKDYTELNLLEQWLKSYKIEELLEGDTVKQSILQQLPSTDLCMGQNNYAQICEPEALILPNLEDLAEKVIIRGQPNASELGHFANYLVRIMHEAGNKNKFRVFSPDESESNKLEPLLEAVKRPYNWPLREQDKFFDIEGRCMEILSEQTLQSWMQGYVMTGGNGVLISYEAFLSIIASQIDQYIKFLRQSKDFAWRKNVPSLNYIATSSVWRQDHNGFTHQNPVLINTLLSKHVDFVNCYFPADVNTMLVTTEKILASKSTVNLVVAGKTDMPQWLNLDEARKQVDDAIMIWDFATNDGGSKPDVVLASIGDYQTLETLAGISILRELCPELKTRYININSLSCLGFGCSDSICKTEEELNRLFTLDRPIVLNFHGYPEAIYQSTAATPIARRMTVLGYLEKGTTTTPFDMQVKNLTSRYHVALQALELGSKNTISLLSKIPQLTDFLNKKIEEHKAYIVEHGEDMPEIQNWKWN
jgi:xylulose-5-phosphate/fructose-6-phosphate phosphoketolase